MLKNPSKLVYIVRFERFRGILATALKRVFRGSWDPCNCFKRLKVVTKLLILVFTWPSTKYG